jgi:Protein of unknown function (DUF3553)
MRSIDVTLCEHRAIMARPARPKASIDASSDLAPAVDKGRFKAGYPIDHPQFGRGTVVTVDGDKLTIRFKAAGTKVVLEGYVKLA